MLIAIIFLTTNILFHYFYNLFYTQSMIMMISRKTTFQKLATEPYIIPYSC